jgi:hypothetical protein
METQNPDLQSERNGDRRALDVVLHVLRWVNFAGLVGIAAFVYQWHRDDVTYTTDVLTRIIILEQYQKVQDNSAQTNRQLSTEQRMENTRSIDDLKRRIELLEADHRKLK